MKLLDLFLIVIIIVGLFSLGWFGNDMYKEWNNEKQLNGLWLKNYDYQGAKEKAYKMDEFGDWVCVNIAFDMDYPEAYETCVHECSHQAFSEIYAEQCENNYEGCWEAINVTK